MIKGLYSAHSAMASAWEYQEVLANNIANANTAGFRREVAAHQSFDDVLLTQQAPTPAPLSARVQAIVGQIGTGKFIAEFQTDFSGGSLQATGQELDLAIEQGFFAVEGPEGETFYTRNGRFDRDANGMLVTSHGYPVLDDAGGPIVLPDGAVRVERDGSIFVGDDPDGGPVAQLAILDFPPAGLERAGEAYFITDAEGLPVEGNILQGFLEGSNTNMTEELTTLLTVQRVYQANQALLSSLDDTLDTATGELGRMS